MILNDSQVRAVVDSIGFLKEAGLCDFQATFPSDMFGYIEVTLCTCQNYAQVCVRKYANRRLAISESFDTINDFCSSYHVSSVSEFLHVPV